MATLEMLHARLESIVLDLRGAIERERREASELSAMQNATIEELAAKPATPAERQLIEAAMLWQRAHQNWETRAEDGSPSAAYEAACIVFHEAEDALDRAAAAVRAERKGVGE